MKQASILIADHQPIYRKGTQQLLSHYAFQIQESENFEQLSKAIHTNTYDLILIDYPLIENNLRVFKTLLAESSHARILVFIREEKKYPVLQLSELQIHGCLHRDCSSQEFDQAIKALLNGSKYFYSYFVNTLIDHKLAPGESCLQAQLTQREMEVARLIATGKKNEEIALQLHLSPHTIHTHRKNIMKKTGARSALELSQYAYETGLI